MFKISLTKKAEGKYCCAYGCRGKPIKKKGGLCHKHYARKRRILAPIETRYFQAKSKAKQRNIDFTITLNQFIWFCNKTGYLIDKYKRGLNASIDRRCSYQGYHIWNIQLLTMIQNRKKSNKVSDNFNCPF